MNLGSLCRRTGLIGAVANAEAKVLVGAVAGDIAGRATELGTSNVDHVGDAGLTTLGKISERLGQSNTSTEGEDSE